MWWLVAARHPLMESFQYVKMYVWMTWWKVLASPPLPLAMSGMPRLYVGAMEYRKESAWNPNDFERFHRWKLHSLSYSFHRISSNLISPRVRRAPCAWKCRSIPTGYQIHSHSTQEESMAQWCPLSPATPPLHTYIPTIVTPHMYGRMEIKSYTKQHTWWIHT